MVDVNQSFYETPPPRSRPPPRPHAHIMSCCVSVPALAPLPSTSISAPVRRLLTCPRWEFILRRRLSSERIGRRGGGLSHRSIFSFLFFTRWYAKEQGLFGGREGASFRGPWRLHIAHIEHRLLTSIALRLRATPSHRGFFVPVMRLPRAAGYANTRSIIFQWTAADSTSHRRQFNTS